MALQWSLTVVSQPTMKQPCLGSTVFSSWQHFGWVTWAMLVFHGRMCAPPCHAACQPARSRKIASRPHRWRFPRRSRARPPTRPRNGHLQRNKHCRSHTTFSRPLAVTQLRNGALWELAAVSCALSEPDTKQAPCASQYD